MRRPQHQSLTDDNGDQDAPEVNRLVRLWGTSIGRKLITGVTGVLLVTFLLGHVYGNMKVFQGPEALNTYATWLRGHPLLWFFRLGLLATFSVHMYLALSLARANRAARPVRYQRWRPQSASIASLSMAVSGIAVLTFLVYHLLHFTFRLVHVDEAQVLGAGRGLDVHGMVVQSFQNPWICAVYVAGMLLVGLHLVHGMVSAFQTFGVHHESYDSLIRAGCVLVIAVIVIGSASIPILIYLGGAAVTGGVAP